MRSGGARRTRCSVTVPGMSFLHVGRVETRHCEKAGKSPVKLRVNPSALCSHLRGLQEILCEALKHAAAKRIQPCTNCGMAPMRRDIAMAKLAVLAEGTALARRRLNL